MAPFGETAAGLKPDSTRMSACNKTGSSPCEHDDLKSATYATLDALNRIFSHLKHREAVEYVLHAEVGAEV